jgi:small-conductance mechanosensitive channel
MIIIETIKWLIQGFFNLIREIWDYDIAVMSGKVIEVNDIVVALIFLFFAMRFWPILEKKINSFLLKILPEDKATQHMCLNIAKYTCWWFIFLLVLEIANVPFKSLTVLTGAFGLGIGFGTKEIIYNFCSGMILVVTKPIKIGDFIKVLDHKGIVYEINIRYITLKTLHDTDIMIPSSKLIENEIINWTSGNLDVRLSVKIQLFNISKLKSVKDDISALIQKEKLSAIGGKKCEMYLASTDEESCSLDVDYFVDISQKSDLFSVKDSINNIILNYAINNDVNIHIKKHEIKT